MAKLTFHHACIHYGKTREEATSYKSGSATNARWRPPKGHQLPSLRCHDLLPIHAHTIWVRLLRILMLLEVVVQSLSLRDGTILVLAQHMPKGIYLFPKRVDRSI